MFLDVRLRKTVLFLRAIHIPVIAREIETETVFPGHLISHGTLIVDERKLFAIGDTLHEAAHIALAPPERRSFDVAFLSADGGEELTAIAWCFAASIAIGLELEDVFHSTAYLRNDSPTIIAALAAGNAIGFPLLQAWGMAFDERHAADRGVEPFPHMVRWLRP